MIGTLILACAIIYDCLECKGKDHRMMTLLVLLGILGILVVWGITIFNRLVRLRNMVEEGWSGIEVQLKRRANLIPNLVETVKGYMGHERDVMERVTALRSQSMHVDVPGERSRVEGDLTRALAKLFAVAERYPDLKANQNFLDLQDELAQIEEQIQLARRYYNGTVPSNPFQAISWPVFSTSPRPSFLKSRTKRNGPYPK